MEPPTQHRPHRKPTAIRREEIAEAALRILASRGAKRLTAKLIAEEVGLTEGAIFRHFATMNEIVDAVLDRMESMLFGEIPAEAGDPIDRLGSFFERRVRVICDNPALSRLLLSEHLAKAAGPERAERLDGFKRRSQAFVLRCLKEAGSTPRHGGGVDPEAGAILVQGAILALAHVAPRNNSARHVKRLAPEVWRALERTIRGGDAAQWAGKAQPPKRIRKRSDR